MSEIHINGNPLCELSHFKEFVVFKLRNIDIVDDTVVMVGDRKKAIERFSQGQ